MNEPHGAESAASSSHNIKLSSLNLSNEYSFGFPQKPEKGFGRPTSLRGILKHGAITGDWTLNHTHHIDFGERIQAQDGGIPSLRVIAESMITQTMADPEQRERGRMSIVFQKEVNGEEQAALVVQTEDAIGTDRQVKLGAHPWPEEIIEKSKIKRYKAMNIHTHPLDYPPSPQDYKGLFLSSEDTNAIMGMLVVTPKRIWMVFRGKHTPQGKEIEEEILSNWSKLYEAEDLQIQGLVDQGADHGLQQGYIQTKLLFEAARELDLQVFSCKVGERYLDKMNLRMRRELLREYQPLQLPAAGQTTR